MCVGILPALFLPHPLLGTFKQVAQHHIQKMIDISPLFCEFLLYTCAWLLGTLHNLCLFTEIIANSFMEHLLCVFLPIYRFDYIIFTRMETWLSTAYSHSHRSSRREDPFKNKMVRTCMVMLISHRQKSRLFQEVPQAQTDQVMNTSCTDCCLSH